MQPEVLNLTSIADMKKKKNLNYIQFWNTIQKYLFHKSSFLTNQKRSTRLFAAVISEALIHYKASTYFPHGRSDLVGISMIGELNQATSKDTKNTNKNE